MWDVAILVCDRQSDLDHFGFFDVAFDKEVFALLFGVVAFVEFAAGGDDAWEFSVLRRWGGTIAMTL